MNNPHDIPQSWEHLDTLLGEMREAGASLAKKKAKRDEDVAAVASKFAPDIEELETAYADLERRSKLFLDQEKVEFGKPGDEGRFKDMIHGRVGFRQATPKLVLLRELTEDEVVSFMTSNNKRRFDRFLRTKISLDKSTILAEMTEEAMEEVGLAVTQDDNPFIALKKG